MSVTLTDQAFEPGALLTGFTEGRSETGAVATFESSLPVYVDPVVPGWLHAGDRLLLPIQVMNNTAEPVQGTLTVEATGPWTGSGSAAVTLSAGGSEDAEALYLEFRGRMPGVEALLRGRGLLDVA